MKAELTEQPRVGVVIATETTYGHGNVTVSRRTRDGEPHGKYVVHVVDPELPTMDRKGESAMQLTDAEALLVAKGLRVVIDECSQLRGLGPVIEANQKVYALDPERIKRFPRGTFLQGRDGFYHTALGDGKFSLAVEEQHKAHEVNGIELPALVLYVPEVK